MLHCYIGLGFGCVGVAWCLGIAKPHQSILSKGQGVMEKKTRLCIAEVTVYTTLVHILNDK